MSEWDQFDDAAEEPEGFDQFETVDQMEVTRHSPPPASKSEQVARDLGWFDWRGSAETMLSAGTGMANQAARGLAGIAGTAAGMVPGGDSPNEKGNKWQEAVPDFTYQPRTEGGQLGVEMLGKGMEGVVEGVKYPASGYRGMAELALGAGTDRAVESMQEFRETPNALGEGVFEYTQSPTWAVVAQMLPEAAASLSPAKKPRLVADRTPQRPIAPEMPPQGYGGIGTPEPPTRPAPTGSVDDFEAVRDALQRGDRQRLADLVNANPAIVAAFDELGVEFTPGMVSENPALRQVEQGLQSVPGSGVGAKVGEIKTAFTDRINQLIDESGGEAGRGSRVASDIEVEYRRIHEDIDAAESAAWDDLREVVPRGIEVDASSAAARIYREAELAGGGDIQKGLKSLRQHERRLFDMTHRKLEDPETGEITFEYQKPTYAAVNRFREDLGNSMKAGKPFSDANSGMLDLMYGEMAGIQGRVAKGNGYGELWEQANKLTQERKALEESMTNTLGRGLNQSVLTRIRTATNKLMDGDVKAWDSLMDDLPESQRQAAAAQALETVFFTAAKGTKHSEMAVANFTKIKRDPALRDRILDPLPVDSRSTFMALGEAMTGFYRAMERSLANPSGTALGNAVQKAIEDGTMTQRLLGTSGRMLERALPVIGQQLFKTVPKADAGAARLQAATDLLADNSFRQAIVQYARGNIEAANALLKKSKPWVDWLKTRRVEMQESEYARLESAGIVALFEEETEE